MQNTITKIALIGTIVTSLFAGCEYYEESNIFGEDWGPEGSFTEHSELSTRGGYLQGELGRVSRLDERGSSRTYGHEGFTMLEVTVDRGDDAAMAILNIDVSPEDLVNLEGYRLVSTRGNGLQVQDSDGNVEEDLTDALDGGGVEVIGCSGPEVGDWDYDEPAEDVVIVIEEDPECEDAVVLSFISSFDESSLFDDNEDQVLSGSVVLVVEPFDR